MLDSGPDTNPGDTGPVPMRSLADYPGCERDSDCPIGLGRCLTELAFNLPDADGVTFVSVGSLDPSLTTAGICTLPCTEDVGACSSLQLRAGDMPVEYSCQVVAAGVSPYDVGAALPFSLDMAAAEAGQAFAAICRPPFELSEEHEASLCEACTSDDTCGAEGLCWNGVSGERGSEAVPGECIEAPRESAGCAFGFAAAELVESDGTTSIGEYCVPLLGTCGACQDGDGDERGIGLCNGGVSPSPIDCDDADADAYLDPSDMSHAFPLFCGAFDKNCNGESDDAEQFVSENHCGGCGVVCSGATGSGDASATRECQPDGSCGIACDSPMNQADCDGDLDNGCETAVTDPSRLVYYDGDVDGDGTFDVLDSPQSPLFTCTPGAIPAGYSATNTDCDDGNSLISGASGVDNTCNNVDENCSGARDEGYLSVSCSTGMAGVCSPGSTSCGAGGAVMCNRTVAPSSELCDNVGEDNDCDGATSDITGPTGADVTLGAACVDTSRVGSCRNGVFACASSGATRAICLSNGPSADTVGNGIDEDCDGVDGDAGAAVYVSTTGNNTTGDGSPSRPYVTVQHAINRARALGRPFVRVASGTYATSIPILFRAGITVVGRFNPSNGWTNDGAATTVAITYNNGSGYNGVPAYAGSLGLACEQGVTQPGGSDYVDYQVNRASGSAPRSVVGGWFENCGWLSLHNGNLRVANATGGGAGSTGATGGTGDGGAAGGIALAFRARGPNGGFGGASGCAQVVNGGRGGDGGDAGYGHPDDNGGNGGAGSGLDGVGGSGGLRSTSTIGAGGSGGGGAAGGHSATAGASGAGAPTPTTSVLTLLNGSARPGGSGGAGTAGGGGGGGGGGGAGLLTGFDHDVTGTSGGGGGAGGCGGGGGVGGAGGGSSIGFVVQGQDLSFINFHVFPGDGGDGGDGGRGGNGGVGGTGGAGGHVNLTGAGPGAAGGNGGSGSGGGGGGGGSGGSSISVAVLAGATRATYFGNPNLVLYRGGLGAGGDGGAGGASGSGGTTSGTAGANGASGIRTIVLETSE